MGLDCGAPTGVMPTAPTAMAQGRLYPQPLWAVKNPSLYGVKKQYLGEIKIRGHLAALLVLFSFLGYIQNNHLVKTIS